MSSKWERKTHKGVSDNSWVIRSSDHRIQFFFLVAVKRTKKKLLIEEKKKI